MAARTGPEPLLSARDLLPSILWLLGTMALGALLSGLLGFWLASSGRIGLVGPLATKVPRASHAAFLMDLWAHSASYGIGLIGGLALALRVRFRRAPSR